MGRSRPRRLSRFAAGWLLTAMLAAACGPVAEPVVPTPATTPALPTPSAVSVAATPAPAPPTAEPASAIATAPPPTATATLVPIVLAVPTSAPIPPLPSVVPTARRLDVPLHRQEHALSCEAAALEMALATLGTEVSEADLLAGLARDPTPRRVKPDGGVEWGDPDLGFVGRWDGVFARDGYGVYEAPIADLARREGFPGSTPVKDVDPEQLYEAVRAGDPVVVWMPYGGQVKGRGAWTTPEGKEVDYVVTEHAVVLAGVDEAEVTFADPYSATLQRMSFARFELAMAELNNRAVIVAR